MTRVSRRFACRLYTCDMRVKKIHTRKSTYSVFSFWHPILQIDILALTLGSPDSRAQSRDGSIHLAVVIGEAEVFTPDICKVPWLLQILLVLTLRQRSLAFSVRLTASLSLNIA